MSTPFDRNEISFGRKISVRSSLGSKEGEDLTFTWEGRGGGGQSSLPYWQQGTDEFESEDFLALRAALRHDERVKRELARFWGVYHKDARGRITKEEYLHVHIKYCLVLIPDITPSDARAAGEEDWEGDSGGEGSMDQAGLYSCLFELADMWCSGVDGAEYERRDLNFPE